MAPRKPKLPTKFTKARRKRFLEAVLVGPSVYGAEGHAGWTRGRAYKYLAMGREVLAALADSPMENLCGPDRELAQFVLDYEMQLEASEVRQLKRVDKAAEEGDWKAAAWIMERRWPDRWGRTRPTKAQKRRQEAEADKAESVAQIVAVRAKEATDPSGSSGAKLMVPEDLFEMIHRISPEVFDQLEEMFLAEGVQVMTRANLGGGITRAELEAASPSPIPEEAAVDR